MLTIEEIKNISFRKATLSGGYRAEDVDAFIDEVISSFEQLKKDKTNLVHKIDVLATRVEQYRSDEETVRNALLTSQKISDASIREAKEKAAKIVRDAEAKAQAILSETDRRTSIEKDNYIRLKADTVALRSELVELYKKHIMSINELPTSADLKKTAEALDEKYPTDTQTSAEQPEAGVNEEEQPKESEQPEKKISEQPSVPRHSSKFAHLKFGENYDVSAD